jgi:hypothetical protein
MMSRDETSFSLVLMSNASKDLYPDNKPNNFIVHLQRPLEMYGKWVIGLKQVDFPLEFKDPIDEAKLLPKDFDVSFSPFQPPETKQTRRKRAVPIEEVHNVMDVDPYDDIEPSAIPDADILQYATTYLDGHAIVKYDHDELKRRIESRKEYIHDILDDMLAKDKEKRQGNAYTNTEKLEFAVKMLELFNVSEINREELESAIALNSNVDSMIDVHINVHREGEGLSPLDTSYDEALKTTLPYNPSIKKLKIDVEEERRKQDEKDLKYVVKELEKTDIKSIRSNEIREMLRARPKTTTAEDIVRQILKKWKVDKAGRDVDGEYAYITHMLSNLGKTEYDPDALKERIEQEPNANLVLAQVYYNLPPGTPMDENVFPPIPDLTTMSVPDLIKAVLKKAIYLTAEINKCIEHNKKIADGTVRGEELSLTDLENELEQSLNYAIAYYRSLGVHHVHVKENYLKDLVESSQTAEEVMKEVDREHSARVAYNEYAKSVRNQPKVPKYLTIYCDAAQVRLVGDKAGPYLGTIRVATESIPAKKTDTYNPPSIDWYPVSKNFIHQIEVDIRDEKGYPASFGSEPLIVQVVLKKVY